MPRELIHWRVAQLALEHPKIAQQSALFSALHRERLSVFLGALAHDVPYYYRAGRDPFEHIANYLHGKDGEDTFDPMRLLAQGVIKRSPDEQVCLWPFLFGMLTHMATDIVFHPMIFYFTGNYHDNDPRKRELAQARHRLFEVYLESWIRPKLRFGWGKSIKTLLLQNRARNNELISDFLDANLLPERLWPLDYTCPLRRRWNSGFRQIALFQQLFVSSGAGLFFRGVCALGGNKLKGIDALFTLGRGNAEEIFDSPLGYKNPVTGEESRRSIEELLQESVELSVEFFLYFEPILTGETEDIKATLGNRIGSSLNYGCPHAKADAGRYFAEEGFPLAGLFTQ